MRTGQIILSKRGDAALRKYLYMATLTMVGTNPVFRHLHENNVQVKHMSKRQSVFKLIGKLASALDHITEARVDAYLSSIKCTRIVIAHRLSTVMNSDMIIVLENGRICDVGNHNQLLHTSSYYQYYYKEMSS